MRAGLLFLVIALSSSCSPEPISGEEDLGAASPRDFAVVRDLGPPGCPPCEGATPVCKMDVATCVGCVGDGDCPAGQLCKVMSPTEARCVVGCMDDARCKAGGNAAMMCCDMACADTSRDAFHCGACGKRCAVPHAKASCNAGRCEAGACDLGWGDCNMDPSDGCEVNLRVDTAHCGGCGRPCNLPNAVAACGRACYIAACNYGFDDCNAIEADGCEVSVLADVNNCGACNMRCGTPARGQAMCTSGDCALRSCDPGFADCNKVFKDGCEIVTATDRNNCGACGNVCLQNQICTNSECNCPPCSFPNARAACLSKQCGIDSCNPGFADCDRVLPNGCEINTNTDAKNCGACGFVCFQGLVCVNGGCTCPNCNIPNAKTACVNNMCVLDSCLSGFANCDGNNNNGCEIDTNASASNCGKCGVVCGGQTPYCLGGVCTAVATSCQAIKKGNPQATDGKYTIDPDANGPLAPLSVYCDMTTDGGGWTLVYSGAGADGEFGLVSDTVAAGDALAYVHTNLSRAVKMALSAGAKESLFKRKMDNAWIKASAPLFDANLATPSSHSHVVVTLVASDGATAQGAIGYSNVNIQGGGDYGVSQMPDGATCNGNTINGFDHHGTNYWHLNCGCQRHYLYSYSNNVQDGDHTYNVNTGLGAWTATQNCFSGEGGGIAFYAAVR